MNRGRQRGKNSARTMSSPPKDRSNQLRRNLSNVGPGTVARCRLKKIAKCECDILQPLSPSCERFDPQASGDGRTTVGGSAAGKAPCRPLSNSRTLIPSSVTRTLYLWKDEEEEYHLTVIREDKDEVFLDLPLSGLLTGSITYDHSRVLWHEVTIHGREDRQLVFNLKAGSNDSPDAKDFNGHLDAVFEKIRLSAPVDREEEDPNLQTLSNSQEVSTLSMASATPVTKVLPKPPGAMLGLEAPSMAAEMPSGLYDNSGVNTPLSAGAAQQMSVALALAIQAGNVMKAQELASRLAHGHAPVSVTFDTAAQERKAKEQEVRVTVHIEDRESAGLTLNNVKVRPSDTILDMKHSFLAQYNFPLEVQKWIIGNKIRSDDETLHKCEVTTSGHTLYLYLLNARSVNLASDDAANRHRNGSMNAAGNSMHPSHGSDYETMNFPASVDFALVPPTGQGQGQISPSGHGQVSPAGHGAARQQSQMSVHSSSNSLASALYGSSPDLQNNLDPGSRPGSMSGGGRGPESRLTLQGEGSAVSLTGGVGGQGGSEEGGGLGEMMSFQQPEESAPEGWQCESCTFINQPTRPGCELCSSPRPPGYQVPAHCVVSDEERQRLEQERQLEAIMQQRDVQERELNYRQLLEAESNDLVSSKTTFVCPICMDDILPGQGIVLRECLHPFCKTCLTEHVRLTEEAALTCPFQDESYACNANLQQREVRALVPDQVYERYLRRSLDVAESQAANSYHCKSADCHGWCIYEDMVNFFDCPVCGQENCLTCRAIHRGMNCKQYQRDLKGRAANDKAAQQTQIMLQDMLEKGEAMPCPQCEVILQKKDGCDWIRCSICKTEICWVTKGRRWGPNGEGDNSGGCKCRIGGRRCHPQCTNCH